MFSAIRYLSHEKVCVVILSSKLNPQKVIITIPSTKILLRLKIDPPSGTRSNYNQVVSLARMKPNKLSTQYRSFIGAF